MSTEEEYQPPGYGNCDEVSDRCPVEATLYGDYFTLGACAFFTAAYGLLLAAQVFLGLRLRAWGYVWTLAVATAVELAGYACRSVMSSNPWNFMAFVMQSFFLVLGPTVVAAAISVTFKDLVLYYGPKWSFIRPRLYPWIFVGTDVLSLLVQCAGGGLLATGTAGDGDMTIADIGNTMMLSGVCFQVVNMVFCGILLMTYVWRRRQAGPQAADEACVETDPAGRLRTKRFVWALGVAYVAIIARCAYRIPEMSMGWGSSLQKNETAFLVMDGAMILLSVLLITVFHPAIFFPYMGKGKGGKRSRDSGMESLSSGIELTTERK